MKYSPGKNKDITVVVQGYVDKEITKKCLSSIRKVIPGSKIILSTWENSKLDGLSYDTLILNEDPGFYYRSVQLIDGKLVKKKINNINRQIISTRNGLRAVTTKFSLKLRSDFLLKHSRFIERFEELKYLNSFDREYKIFKNRLLCCQCGTYKVNKGRTRLPYHYSDLAYFGLTNDLINLFEIPLATDQELKYFENIGLNRKKETWATNQYNCEQTVIKNWLIKNKKSLDFQYSTHASKKNIQDSEKYLINNFLPLSYSKFGLSPTKDHLKYNFHFRYYKTYYTENDWLKLYKKYQDSTLKIPLIDRERLLIIASRNTPKFFRTPIVKKASNYL
tara:strand:- start:11759 stop:12760 length:1002 start_codon:yes stop_codon:yes gene_type:complete